jgi:hypothetical protein
MAEGMGLRSNALCFQAIECIASRFCCGSNPQREANRFIEIAGASILASTACCIAQMFRSAESGTAYCAISSALSKTEHYARHPTALGRHAFNGLVASLEDSQHYAVKGPAPKFVKGQDMLTPPKGLRWGKPQGNRNIDSADDARWAMCSALATGGLHRWFCHQVGFRFSMNALPGLDVRAEGGHVILPGSVGAVGEPWRFLNDLVADTTHAPEWLAHAFRTGKLPLSEDEAGEEAGSRQEEAAQDAAPETDLTNAEDKRLASILLSEPSNC